MSIFITIVAIFLMTGALYFRNQVTITDGSNTFMVFTTQSEPEDILAEQGIVLTELDFYSFGGFELGTQQATLEITRSHSVAITADGAIIRTQAFTNETVGEVLARAGVSLGRYDIVTPALYTAITGDDVSVTGDTVINVSRAFDITVYIGGEAMMFPVPPNGSVTVAEVLEREGFTLGEEDLVSTNMHLPAHPGMEAAVSLVRYVERLEENIIPYETFEQTSNLLAIGEVETVIEGVEGREYLTLREKTIDGAVVASEVLSRRLISQPTDELLSVGSALAAPFSKRDFDEIELVNGRPVNYEFKLSGVASAYTAGPRDGTASGRTLEIGTVAINPAKIPYGSLLYIVTQDGTIVYGAAVAADTGTFIYEDEILVDLYKGLTSTNFGYAARWGLKDVDVYVINTGKY
ncbi:MAG: ubiquitin-like domain-containing protein [Oscillospiraceae bacterium]|nr:ubiquitin-like domain-containing protein [Oscillospiraceae bacterium]